MPTYEATARFWREFRKLTRTEQQAFLVAVVRLRLVVANKELDPALRIKAVQGATGVFELTWAPDGRATFEFGEAVRPGEPHIVWRRVGTHDIFQDP